MEEKNAIEVLGQAGSIANEKGELFIGRTFHRLTDYTRRTYKARTLSDFAKYCKKTDSQIAEGIARPEIFFDASDMEVKAIQFAESDRYTVPLAELKLKRSPFMDRLLAVNGKFQSAKDFEGFLRFMAAGDCAPWAIDLVHQIRQMNFSKVTKVEQTKQPNGDYTYSVARSGGTEKGEFEPPRTATFIVEPLHGTGKTVSLPFDIFFDFQQVEDKVNIQFKIENPLVDLIAEEAFNIAVSEELEGIGWDVFAGELEIKKQTDDWAIKESQQVGF